MPQFTLHPILQKMQQLYQLPRTRERFEAYLLMLQGKEKTDMILPIAGYNPMGADHILSKLNELQNLNAEQIIQEELENINANIHSKKDQTIQVVLNLADDIGGAWTDRYTTDFSSKFEIQAFVKRNFCTPYFWTSEAYTQELIIQRTREYAYRTLHTIEKGKPTTLKDHIEQEIYVQLHSNNTSKMNENDFSEIKKHYTENANSEDYNLIFNFFYGDEASESLAYKTYGIRNNAGWDYVKFVARRTPTPEGESALKAGKSG